MIALIRMTDNQVMNDRQGSDWPEAKKKKLAQLQTDLENTPANETQRRQEIQQAINTLQTEWDLWLLNRCKACAKQFGGVAADYSTVEVPKEDQQAFFHARSIEYDGNSLTFDTRPPYLIEGSVITCTKGWVRGNEQLLADDETDWSGETLTEPVFFQLWYARNVTTQEISVQLLVRNEDEEFSELPANLEKIGRSPVCEGRVNLDNSITLGGF